MNHFRSDIDSLKYKRFTQRYGDCKIIICGKNSVPLYKFSNISVNFEDTKMVDHILEISRPVVFDIRCLNWNTTIIVFMKKGHMDGRQYKSPQ